MLPKPHCVVIPLKSADLCVEVLQSACRQLPSWRKLKKKVDVLVLLIQLSWIAVSKWWKFSGNANSSNRWLKFKLHPAMLEMFCWIFRHWKNWKVVFNQTQFYISLPFRIPFVRITSFANYIHIMNRWNSPTTSRILQNHRN